MRTRRSTRLCDIDRGDNPVEDGARCSMADGRRRWLASTADFTTLTTRNETTAGGRVKKLQTQVVTARRYEIYSAGCDLCRWQVTMRGDDWMIVMIETKDEYWWLWLLAEEIPTRRRA